MTHRSLIARSVLAGAATLVLVSCESSQLTAPQGTTFTFISATTMIATGTLDITVDVNQGGTSTGGGQNATTPSGLPVHDGTVVDFATTLGTVSPLQATTKDGQVHVTLVGNGTTGSAKVTANSGSVLGSTTITVGASTVGALSISLPGQSGVVSTPANFTIGVSGTSGATNVSVDFGDGNQESVGAIAANSTATATHLYSDTGTFQVTATATAADGGTASNALTIAIAPLTLTPTGPTTISAGTSGSYTVTPTTGAFIDTYQWDFGDGTVITTASNTQTHVYTTAGTKTVTITVNPTKGAQRVVTLQVQVN